jgi:hypothetical protein
MAAMNRGTAVLTIAAAVLFAAACGVAFPDGSGDCVARTALHARLADVSIQGFHLEDIETGESISMRVPGGYGVNNKGEILDPADRVIAREGDIVVSGCRDYVQDAVMIRESDVRPAP